MTDALEISGEAIGCSAEQARSLRGSANKKADRLTKEGGL